MYVCRYIYRERETETERERERETSALRFLAALDRALALPSPPSPSTPCKGRSSGTLGRRVMEFEWRPLMSRGLCTSCSSIDNMKINNNNNNNNNNNMKNNITRVVPSVVSRVCNSYCVWNNVVNR